MEYLHKFLIWVTSKISIIQAKPRIRKDNQGEHKKRRKKQDVKRKSRRRVRTHPVFIHNAYTRDGVSDESFPRMVTLHDRLDTKWLLARTHYLAFAVASLGLVVNE